MAFPWACSRHCAVHLASRTTHMYYVCQMTPITASTAIVDGIPNALIQSAKPAIVQFILASALHMRYTLHSTSYTASAAQWQMQYIATPVPPPKYTFL